MSPPSNSRTNPPECWRTGVGRVRASSRAGGALAQLSCLEHFTRNSERRQPADRDRPRYRARHRLRHAQRRPSNPALHHCLTYEAANGGGGSTTNTFPTPAGQVIPEKVLDTVLKTWVVVGVVRPATTSSPSALSRSRSGIRFSSSIRSWQSAPERSPAPQGRPRSTCASSPRPERSALVTFPHTGPGEPPAVLTLLETVPLASIRTPCSGQPRPSRRASTSGSSSGADLPISVPKEGA